MEGHKKCSVTVGRIDLGRGAEYSSSMQRTQLTEYAPLIFQGFRIMSWIWEVERGVVHSHPGSYLNC